MAMKEEEGKKEDKEAVGEERRRESDRGREEEEEEYLGVQHQWWQCQMAAAQEQFHAPREKRAHVREP